jgi:hypothetical protein
MFRPGVWPAAESMPDAGADFLPAQRPPVHLMVVSRDR